MIKDSPLWYRLIRLSVYVIFKILFNLIIRGKEKIPLRGGVILVSNHSSYLDPVVLGLTTPRRINFMAKEELFKNFFFRRLITLLGAFPVKRGEIDKFAYRKVLSIVRREEIIALFPEGTRGRGEKLGVLRKGAVKLIFKTKLPVIPVIIKGTEKALPRGKKMIRLKKIRAYVGDSLRKIDRESIFYEELTKKMNELFKSV